jgi:hypothetical protein
VLLAQFAWVAPTNFGGFDEWVIVSLVEQGISSLPSANRPFALLWSQPAGWLPPSLWSFYALHVTYLAAAAALVFWLLHRLLPGHLLLAFLAALFSAVWVPSDYFRLNVLFPYAGHTFSAFLAVVLLLESWLRRAPALLATAVLVAFVSVRGYEGNVALLAGAPLLLWAAPGAARRAWVAAWEAGVLLAALLTALPMLLPGRQLAYQAQVLGGVDLDPIRGLGRLAGMFRSHLAPLVSVSWSELAVRAVPAAVAVFLLAGVVVAKLDAAGASPLPAPRRLLVMAGLGVVFAALGYSVFAVIPGEATIARTQFLSGAGIGALLAAAFALAASRLPSAGMRAVLIGLGAWVVAVGTGRTVAMQGFWSAVSVHHDQVRLLRQTVRIAPRFVPNTFVILIDDTDTFPATFPFRAALTCLYPRGEAFGYVWRKWDILYPAQFTPEGVVNRPAAELREPHFMPVTHHRFDEMVVFRHATGGQLSLFENWPDSLLFPLPAGARYAPRERIREGASPRERALIAAAPGSAP